MTTGAATPASPGSRIASAQDALGALVAEGLVALDTAVDQFVRAMNATTRSMSPSDGGWSIDAILEHLCLTSDLYLAAMQEALRAQRAPHDRGRWRPTLGGRLLAWSMTSSLKLPAPRVIVPGPVPRADVLDAFLRGNASLRSLMESARDREWRRVRFASPLSRRVSINFGDAALVILRHGERHHQQMRRVIRSISG